MSEALKRAQRGLQFDDVFQSRVDAWLNDEFDPRFSGLGSGLAVQIKHQVIQSSLIELSESNAVKKVFRVFIDVGVRLRRGGDPEHQEPVAQIEASYRLDYLVKDMELANDQEALDAFALQNSSYHLWPYWREYLMSQSLRMNLPKVPLPMQT